MNQSFIFGGNTGLSYDQIQKQRDIANELLRANMSTPQNVGEGLSAIGRALAAKAIDKRTTRADEANRQASEARRADAFGMIFGGGAGGSSAPYSPQPPVAFDPNSPKGVASDTMAALGKSVYTPGDRESFVAAMMPHALRVSQMTGLDPRLVIAQAAQETGWGKSSPNNNYFGIKSHGKGGANLGTFEYVNGQRVNVNDNFRTYDSMGQSAEDYARFLMENPRYKDMLAAGDLEGQLAALGRSGYATDPNYASSVGSIASSIQIPGMSAPQSGGAPSSPAMGNPATIQVIADLLADPYTPPGEKAMLEQAMAMQLQGMDPMRQLEMEKARLELHQLRNPPAPAMPADVVELQWRAENAGLVPGTPEYQDFIRTGGSGPLVDFSGANIGGSGQSVDFGDPPKDMVWLRDDAGNVLTEPDPGGRGVRPVAVPVGGSQIAEDRQSAQEKGDRTKEQTRLKLGTTLENLNLNIQDIEDGGLPVTGAIGDLRRTWLGRAVTGDGAMDFGNRTNQITDSAALAEVQNMRDNSPTGGAVGSLTDDERRAIGNAVTSLNNSTSAAEYARAAKNFRKLALDLAYGEGTWELDENGQPRLAGSGNGTTDADGWTTINGVKIRVKQ